MMSPSSIGDLAQLFLVQRQTSILKQRMETLTADLASGHSINRVAHVPGAMKRLGDLSHDLVVLAGYRGSAREAALTTAAMQTALGRVQDGVTDLNDTAVLARTSAGRTHLATMSGQGREVLEIVISGLNADFAGKALFAGSDVLGAPLASAGDFLDAARAAVAGATNAADVMSGLSAMFEDPAGAFLTGLYRGNSTPLSPYQLGAGESVALDLRADGPAFRTMFRHVVAAALVQDPGLALSEAENRELARLAGDGLTRSQGDLTGIRASLGHAESRIEAATSRLSAELNTLEQARTDMLAVDPFQTATELEAVQSRIETLYAITARSSRLSLVSFLS